MQKTPRRLEKGEGSVREDIVEAKWECFWNQYHPYTRKVQ